MTNPYNCVNKTKAHKRSGKKKESKITDQQIVNWVAWTANYKDVVKMAVVRFGEKRLIQAVNDGIITISGSASLSHSGKAVLHENKIELTRLGRRIYYN